MIFAVGRRAVPGFVVVAHSSDERRGLGHERAAAERTETLSDSVGGDDECPGLTVAGARSETGRLDNLLYEVVADRLGRILTAGETAAEKLNEIFVGFCFHNAAKLTKNPEITINSGSSVGVDIFGHL